MKVGNILANNIISWETHSVSWFSKDNHSLKHGSTVVINPGAPMIEQDTVHAWKRRSGVISFYKAGSLVHTYTQTSTAAVRFGWNGGGGATSNGMASVSYTLNPTTITTPATANTGSSSSAELQGSAGAKYYEGQVTAVAAGKVLVDRTLGTIIGSQTSAGLWDGSNTTGQTSGGGGDNWAGKDWGVGNTKTITGYAVWNNENTYGIGVHDTTVNVKLQGSTDGFSSSIVTLGETGLVPDGQGQPYPFKIEKLTGITATTAYRYHRILIPSSTNVDVRWSELELYEDQAAVTGSDSMTLISTTTTALTAPTKASIVLQTEDEVGTATINTDVKAGVSRDALNYVDTTLAKIGTWGSGNVYAANDVTMPGTITKAVVVNNSKFSIDGGESTPTVSGGTTTTDGSYTVHTFTSSGTFTTDNTQDMEYLVIAGGGGGGGGQTNSNYGGAGGGAGGMRFGTGITFTTGLQYAITVGAGGTAGSHVTNSGSEKNPDDAEDSSIIHSGTSFNITSSGGGGGSNRQRGAGGNGTSDGYNDGHDGGSGGGGCGGSTENPEGGAGINDGGTFGTATFQGYDGGEGYTGGSGGGGGASAVGSQSSSNAGAAGGAGRAHSITGSSVTYAGGGGGGSATGDSTTSSGGSGGGGNGGASNVHGADGTDNTGGGGGGGGRSYAGASANGGAGGSGIVIIRRPTSIPGPTTQELTEGYTYKFDTSDSTLSGHTFKFATAADAAGSTEYTTGVTTSGTPGSAGAYTQIVVAASAPTLYYYCSNHASMGGTANTPAEAATTSMRYKVQTKNQSASKVTRIHGTSLAWK